MTKTAAQILKNPGLLKLELMRRGLRVDPAVLEEIRPPSFGVTGHALFGSAWDLDLVLPHKTWASVPVRPNLTRASPYRLSKRGTKHVVTTDDDGAPATPVQIQPAPTFFRKTTSSGLPLGRIGTVHGPYLALSPTNHCQFLTSADRCRFCGVAETGSPHDAVPVEDIVEAVRIARGEHTVNMVHLSVGWLGSDDGGVRLLEPYVNALKKHFDVLVAVDALPPKDNGWIDRTYGMGADAVSYNLEIWDPTRFKEVCPGPARVIGRERFLDALGYATTVFPSGGVVCHLIVGLEPLASTREGMAALAELGVVPVLPVYRPFKGRDMRTDGGQYEPSLEELSELYAELYALVRRKKLSLSLVRDIATVTTPLEGRFFAGGRFGGVFHKLTGSRFGRRTSARLSDLRRALRVREVGIVDP